MGSTKKTPSAFSDQIDPRELVEHRFSTEHFGLGDEADQDELAASIAAEGVRRPLTITGERCASPPNYVLGGCRRRAAAIRAGLASVPVRRLDDLSAEDEESIVIGENLADQLGRRLLESRRAALERVLLERRRKGQGHRSDLQTSADASGGSRGDARDIVAKELGVARNAVADRQTIFYSPVAPDTVKGAVDAGEISRSEAARMVRQVERQPDVAAVLAEPEHATINAARTVVEEAVRDRLRAGKKSTKTGKAPPKQRVDTVVQPLRPTGSDLAAEIALDDMRWEATVRGDTLALRRVGRVPTVATPIEETETRWDPLTIPVSVSIAREVVDELPLDIASDITVGPVILEHWCACRKCGGTRFWRNRRLQYRCTGCHEPGSLDVPANKLGLSLDDMARARVRGLTAKARRFRDDFRHSWFTSERRFTPEWDLTSELGVTSDGYRTWKRVANRTWEGFLANEPLKPRQRFNANDVVDLRCPRFAQDITIAGRVWPQRGNERVYIRWWHAADRDRSQPNDAVLVEIRGVKGGGWCVIAGREHPGGVEGMRDVLRGALLQTLVYSHGTRKSEGRFYRRDWTPLVLIPRVT